MEAEQCQPSETLQPPGQIYGTEQRSSYVNSITADSEPILESVDGYESDALSAGSTSLSSSIQSHVFENNRRYHKFCEGRYLLPNDDIEQGREDMKHLMIMRLCEDKLHFAPLVFPQKILDVGTGTGIWAIEMGDIYPSAEVIGTDLSPIQSSWVPPNVKFYVDDAESEWLDATDTLDLVHARHMCMAIKDWPKFLGQAFRALKPGGWVELQDLRLAVQCDDSTMPDDYGVRDFLVNLRRGFEALEYDLLSLEKNKLRLSESKFINVVEKVWKVPIGAWPKDRRMKEVGLYNRLVLAEALQGVSLVPYTRGLGWTATEVEAYLPGIRKALTDASIHSYYTFHAVYGQKPAR